MFDEQRIFEKGVLENCVKIKGVNFGLPICEDIWKETVLKKLSQSGAEIIIAINASPFTISKYDERNDVALSRVKSLDGLYLSRPIKVSDIRFDKRIYNFQKTVELFH